MAPFHSMVDHFLYHNNQNRNEPTMFNWIGVSPSYNSGRGARNLLNGYEFELSVSDNVPMSTHFTWTSFTMCAFDNADYSEKSSLADIDSRYKFLWCCFKMQVRNYYLILQDHQPMLVVRCHVLSIYHAKLLVLIKSHLLDLPYFLTFCFHQKIVLLSILILSSKKKAAKAEFCNSFDKYRTAQTLLWAASQVLAWKSSVSLMRVGF